MRPQSQLCTSISAPSCEGMAKKAELALSLGSDLVELRIDKLCEVSERKILKHLAGFFDRAVVTVRSASEGGGFRGWEESREGLLKSLASHSPAFIDVELRTVRSNDQLLDSLKGAKTIVSWHHTTGTPPLPELQEKTEDALECGDIAKIVTKARTLGDSLRLLSLYGSGTRRRLVAFCMGERGVASRLAALQHGSPLTYCSLPGEPLAAGQIPIDVMKRLLELMEL